MTWDDLGRGVCRRVGAWLSPTVCATSASVGCEGQLRVDSTLERPLSAYAGGTRRVPRPFL